MNEEQAESVIDALNTINITLARIYDVQMMLLSINHSAYADALIETHERGNFVGPAPTLSENPFNLPAESVNDPVEAPEQGLEN